MTSGKCQDQTTPLLVALGLWGVLPGGSGHRGGGHRPVASGCAVLSSPQHRWRLLSRERDRRVAFNFKHSSSITSKEGRNKQISCRQAAYSSHEIMTSAQQRLGWEVLPGTGNQCRADWVESPGQSHPLIVPSCLSCLLFQKQRRPEAAKRGHLRSEVFGTENLTGFIPRNELTQRWESLCHENNSI